VNKGTRNHFRSRIQPPVEIAVKKCIQWQIRPSQNAHCGVMRVLEKFNKFINICQYLF